MSSRSFFYDYSVHHPCIIYTTYRHCRYSSPTFRTLLPGGWQGSSIGMVRLWVGARQILTRPKVPKTAKLANSAGCTWQQEPADYLYKKDMAEQTGPIKIAGAIHGICFYQMDGKHYARLKSSLSGKRVKTSAAFKNTMKYAALLANASRIGSVVYRALSKERKGRKVYQQLTGKAMQLLKKGMVKEDVIALMEKDAGLS